MDIKTTPKILQGFCELLPNDQKDFDNLVNKIKSSYAKYGFSNIDTPVIEYSDVLLAKAGGETEKQIYRFNHYDNDLSMRFDLTVPLARYVSMHWADLVFPFKRSQIGKVFRGERPQKGRFREFYQCDADVIGFENLDIKYDSEMAALIYDTMKSLNLGDFVIRINNRKILSGFFSYLGLSDYITEILRIIDKLEKMGLEKVNQELLSTTDLMTSDTIKKILDFVSISGSNKEKIDKLKNMQGNELFFKGVEELEDVINTSYLLGVDEENIRIDLSIARGLDYYTGTVYETNLIGHENFGSVCSGGRYDNLTNYYSDKIMPGVGISIGITRLFSLLKENNMLDSIQETKKGCVILPMSNDVNDYASNVAKLLRANNVTCDVFWSEKSGKAKFKYASRTGYKYTLVLGEDEKQNNKISLKDLETGTQETLDASEVINILKQ